MRNSFNSGVEGNLIEPIENIRRRPRRFRPFARVDLNQDGIVRVAFANEWRDRRIAGVTAVPIRLAIDFDRPEHRRQAGRSEQNVGGDLRVAENPSAAGSHIRRRDKELDRRANETVEIDALGENGTERI
jgi:hypothetical protein